MEKQKLFVVKIGGNIIDDEQKLQSFLKDLASITEKVVLIHGGGKIATEMASKLNIAQQMVEGRRITDKATLDVVTMVYAGLINKNIVASLQALGSNAIGLCGADANVILANKRPVKIIDYGFVGDVETVNTSFLTSLLHQGMKPVFSAITHDGKGNLLNTNADTMAQTIATSLSKNFDVNLVYSFEKEGVLLDVNDDSSIIARLDSTYYATLKAEAKIFDGMIPKLDNAFEAIGQGVKSVIIGKAEKLTQLIEGNAGTQIV